MYTKEKKNEKGNLTLFIDENVVSIAIFKRKIFSVSQKFSPISKFLAGQPAIPVRAHFLILKSFGSFNSVFNFLFEFF